MSPTVPRAERSVGTQALPGVRLPSVPEGAFSGMEKTFGAAEKLYENELINLDETRLSEERRVFFEQFEYPFIYDPKSGAVNRRGRDAIGVGIDVEKNADTFVADRLKGLGNERQKAAYKQWAESRKEGLRKWAAGHEAAQGEADRGNEV